MLIAPMSAFYSDSEGASTDVIASSVASTIDALLGGGFSHAEISFAVAQFWRDRTTGWVFAKSRPINPGFFIPHIEELRRLQASLSHRMSSKRMHELVSKFPSELSTSDFGVCGYDANDEPMYMYKRVADIRKQIESSRRIASTSSEPTTRDDSRESSTYALFELL